jgi:transposase
MIPVPMEIVTRIAYSKNLDKIKLDELTELARRLGEIRRDIWHEFGALKNLKLNQRQIRDSWMKSKKFNVPARLWKETLRDAFQDIELYRAACVQAVIKDVYRNDNLKSQRKELCRMLKNGQWVKHNYLHRRMRRTFKHGQTEVENQIVLDSGCYRWFEKDGKGWLSITGLTSGKRVNIPLGTNRRLDKTLRLIIRGGRVEIHYTQPAEVGRACPNKAIGADKGYTECLTDSDGTIHGAGLGKLLSAESDYLKLKYQRRNKIKKNKPGRIKLDRRKARHRSRIKDVCYKAAHSVCDKANVIASEDLSTPIKGKSFGANQNRRLSAWVKGYIKDSLTLVSQRRGASLHYVNAAYTSQVVSQCGHFGDRNGDTLYCTECKVVVQADKNAAKNILDRLYDSEIELSMRPPRVKRILLSRILPTDGTAHPGF